MAYENLREAINPQLAALSDRKLEAAMERANIDAESAENWLSTLGSIGQAVLPVAGKVVGSFFGGPALGGAIGGAVGSLAGGALGSLTGQKPSAPMGGGAPAPGGSGAAGQLMQTIARPETMQALMSMFMGQMGRPNVQVGSTPVPVGAFTNLLSSLAGRAASEYNAAMSAASDSVPRYMQDYAGQPKGDPAIASDRADALYELLENTRTEQESAESAEAAEYAQYESAMEAANSEYDAMDRAELYESAEDV
jgi:hypothetical protein